MICFAKFTDPIRDVTNIRRISDGYPPSGLRVPEAELAILKYKDLKMRPYYSVTYGHIQKGSVNVEVGSRDYSHLKKVLNKQKFS